MGTLKVAIIKRIWNTSLIVSREKLDVNYVIIIKLS